MFEVVLDAAFFNVPQSFDAINQRMKDNFQRFLDLGSEAQERVLLEQRVLLKALREAPR